MNQDTVGKIRLDVFTPESGPDAGRPAVRLHLPKDQLSDFQAHSPEEVYLGLTPQDAESLGKALLQIAAQAKSLHH